MTNKIVIIFCIITSVFFIISVGSLAWYASEPYPTYVHEKSFSPDGKYSFTITRQQKDLGNDTDFILSIKSDSGKILLEQLLGTPDDAMKTQHSPYAMIWSSDTKLFIASSSGAFNYSYHSVNYSNSTWYVSYYCQRLLKVLSPNGKLDARIFLSDGISKENVKEDVCLSLILVSAGEELPLSEFKITRNELWKENPSGSNYIDKALLRLRWVGNSHLSIKYSKNVWSIKQADSKWTIVRK